MNAIEQPQTRYLTHDETTTFPWDHGGEEDKAPHMIDREVRIRAWQGVDATAVVLAMYGGYDPEYGSGLEYITSRVANYANSAILKHTANGMLYFEAERRDPAITSLPAFKLYAVHFDFYGQAHRLKMFKPEREPMEWPRFELLLGESVEQMDR
jgi:hypothetical protein